MIPFRTTVPVHASPAVTMALIVANIAVFFYQLGLDAEAQAAFVYSYALVPAVYSHPDLARQVGLDPHSYLPFVSNTFMHGGGLHLALNMWTLWLFGAPVEDALGRWRFICLYLACGGAGSVLHLLFNLNSGVPALGASGAIAGVLGAYTVHNVSARVVLIQPIFVFPLIFRLPAWAFTGVWFGLQLYGGWVDLDAAPDAGGIAWWAHVGGFVVGLAAAWALALGAASRRPPAAAGHGPPGPRGPRRPWR